MPLKQIIQRFESKPKNLFLIDGLGAILSAFLLGVVLVKLERFFGIPASTLYFLAILPIFFAIFDFYCFLNKIKNVGDSLKIIATLNLLYCFLSLGLAVYHIDTITSLGWAYLLIEVLIVASLAILELEVARSYQIRH
jgi:hypothetical protein